MDDVRQEQWVRRFQLTDPETFLAIAKLARDRAALYAVPALTGYKNGMEHRDTEDATEQLARDLEVSAKHCGGDERDEEA